MEKTDEQIIDSLGGATAVSRLLGSDITPQAVSQWKKNGIPSSWRRLLALMSPESFADESMTTESVADAQG